MHEGEPAAHYMHNLETRYTNYFEVGYNSAEVIVDCGCFYAGEGGPTIHTRIATTPTYAKALLETLLDALNAYERAFGVIRGRDSQLLEKDQ